MTSHVWLDERGVAWLDDTNVKVVEVALDSPGRRRLRAWRKLP
jgi:hypothetical protein